MKQSPVNLIVLASCLGLFAMSLCTTAVAGDVYQWKDTRGVTQYSSSPPPKGTFTVRTINNKGAAGNAVADVKAAENPQCSSARMNLQVLQGKGAVQQDTDGDGKGDKVLSESERASQLTLSKAMIDATCTASTTVTAQK